jgi:hypothetical protein
MSVPQVTVESLPSGVTGVLAFAALFVVAPTNRNAERSKKAKEAINIDGGDSLIQTSLSLEHPIIPPFTNQY